MPRPSRCARRSSPRGSRWVLRTSCRAAAARRSRGWCWRCRCRATAALGPVRRLARGAAFWIGIALAAALVLAILTVRSVTQPVHRLRAAAAAVAGGQLDTEVEVKGHDELSQLAFAFNEMTRGLRE